jgi:hypothetical protein
VRLPGPDGAETPAALLQADPGMHCCFLGGYLDDEAEARPLALGVAVVAKPFRPHRSGLC